MFSKRNVILLTHYIIILRSYDVFHTTCHLTVLINKLEGYTCFRGLYI